LGGKLSDGFRASAARDTVPPRIDAWVTPPSYTGKPPIFLTANTDQAAAPFTVPVGSELSLRVTGGQGAETLAYVDATGNSRDLDPSDDKSAATASPQSSARQFAGKLNVDGTLTLKAADEELAQWSFVVTPDT